MSSVALVLRGGISRVSGRLLNPIDVSEPKATYVNFEACANSLRKNVLESNLDHKFDFYIQSWNPDLSERLDALYEPKASIYESNMEFESLLNHLTGLSIRNQRASGDLDRLLGREEGLFAETYAGISQALALKKAIGLLESQSTPEKYDLIILARPDVVLLKPLQLSRYWRNAIYVNRYAKSMGDFRWVFRPEKRFVFSNLFDTIEGGNYHKLHHWIRDYIRDTSREKYIQDKVVAGKDEEVLRKTKHSGIPMSVLREFGVTESEYDTYDRAS